MTDLEPLKALLAQTERERDTALAHHRKVLAARDAARLQAEQLVTYRREYEQRWAAQFRREGKMELVHCYQGFTERLTQAVDGQGLAVEQAETQLERATAALRDNEIRCASVRRLIERRVQGWRIDQERSEQRIGDELAARAVAYRTSPNLHAA